MDRRRFLQSLFGLRAVTAETPVEAAERKSAESFFWANLKTGQIGFPSGLSIPSGMPGSVMKLVTAALVHEQHIDKDVGTIDCNSVIKVSGKTYSCLYAHGKVDLVKAIALSCNVYFAQVARKLNPAAIVEYARLFGLERPLAGYGPQVFPKKVASDPVPYALGLAPDLQPNALQMMRLSALVAGRGTSPALHDASRPDDCEEFKVELSDETWTILQQGMKLSAREGTGKKLDPDNKLHLAVKTGTTPHGKVYQSWLIGYFPYETPRYCFCVRAYSGTSIEQAIPAARRFLFASQWL